MRRLLLFTFALLAGFALPGAAKAPSLEGRWEGLIQSDGGWYPAFASLRQDGAALSGTISVASLGLRNGRLIGAVEGASARLAFETARLGTVMLSGRVRDGVIRSEATPEKGTRVFVFLRQPEGKQANRVRG